MAEVNEIISWSSSPELQITLSNLNPIFIFAPREISKNRLKQIIKKYLPKGNLLLGIAKEEFIEGFEGQPQFRTLSFASAKEITSKVNAKNLKHKIIALEYKQREITNIIKNINIKRVLLVNGSWRYAFHYLEPAKILKAKGIDYKYISAFANDEEALMFDKLIQPRIATKYKKPVAGKLMRYDEVVKQIENAAKYSYDYSFQTGAIITKITGAKFSFLDWAHNKIVPYETFALLNGSSREKHKTAVNDVSHYDTVHAEVEIILQAQKNKQSLVGTALFLNLLPCPTCARMLVDTDIESVYYKNDHSNCYAVQLFKQSGIQVEQII